MAPAQPKSLVAQPQIIGVYRRGGAARTHMVPLGILAIGLAILLTGGVTKALLGPPPADFALGASASPGNVAQLRASNSEDYDSEQITVEAGGPIFIEFSNDDVHPHNVAIDLPTGLRIGKPTAEAGTTVRYEFVPVGIEPGRHRFFCTLHPWMEGVLVVN